MFASTLSPVAIVSPAAEAPAERSVVFTRERIRRGRFGKVRYYNVSDGEHSLSLRVPPDRNGLLSASGRYRESGRTVSRERAADLLRDARNGHVPGAPRLSGAAAAIYSLL